MITAHLDLCAVEVLDTDVDLLKFGNERVAIRVEWVLRGAAPH